MDDDLNTADAISVLFEIVRAANTVMAENGDKDEMAAYLSLINEIGGVLNILTRKPEKEEIDSEIESLIEKRQAARKNRDFAEADRIRDELLNRGIILEDTREGVKWHRK